MKKILITIFAGLALAGFSAALEGSGYGTPADSGYHDYGYRGDSYSKHYHRSHRDYRYYRKYERRILKKIRKNQRRIIKLERKIRKLLRRRAYRGYYKHRYYSRKIRRYERKIRYLERKNRHLRRMLRR